MIAAAAQNRAAADYLHSHEAHVEHLAAPVAPAWSVV